MIVRGSKEISGRYLGNKIISAVYKGTKLIWEAISSCFGSGAWIGERPWSGTDAWRGN